MTNGPFGGPAGNVMTALNQAMGAHQSGRLADAERLYREVLAADPNQFEALHFFGLLKAQTGDLQQAHELMGRSLAVNQSKPEAFANFARLQTQMGRNEDALASCNSALTLRPQLLEAQVTRARAFCNLRRFEEALASCDKVLGAAAKDAVALTIRGHALNNLGRAQDALMSYGSAIAVRADLLEAWLGRTSVLFALGRFEEAAGAAERAATLGPKVSDAWLALGNSLDVLGLHERAVAAYDRALAIDPNLSGAWLGRGNALLGLGRHDDALVALDKALEITPSLIGACHGRGNVLYEAKRYDEALAAYDEALLLSPDFADALVGRGNTLDELKRHREALEAYDKALALAPDSVDAWLGRGNVLDELRRYDEALASFQRAQELAPDRGEAQTNEAHVHLLLGDTERGWPAYEARMRTREQARHRRALTQTRWRGEEPLQGKRILLHAEQGFGDTLQFCRYAPLVAEKGGDVLLQVQPALKSIVQSIGHGVTVIGSDEEIPACDYETPLLSLPLAFRTSLQTIPARVPYLTADPAKVAQWQERVRTPSPGRLKIGIACSGNPNQKNNKHRLIPLQRFAPILREAQFFIVQKGLPDDERVFTRDTPSLDYLGELERADVDFGDTAAIVANLDLVISVDTSLVHLAGALGKPVWILVSYVHDWRWLLDRDDNPWYPTARLFRQTEMDNWDGVMERVAAALKDFRPLSV